MSLSAGNLLSATVGASSTLGQEILAERTAERSAGERRQPEQDFSFDPLSTCIGTTPRSICIESAEFRAAHSDVDRKAPVKS